MKINTVYLKGQDQVSGWNKPNKIIIHHPEFYGSVEALNDLMRNMNYTMVGYNYYVRKDGTVWKGRPDNVTSANCYGQNNCSLGVCFEGNYDKDPSMPDAQFNAGVELVKYLKNKYGISEVGGHKKYYNTACPGKNFPLNKMIDAINETNLSEESVKQTGVVTASALNVRSGAGTDFGEIGLLDNGSKVSIIAKIGVWYKINFKGGVGFVHSSYISIKEETKPILDSNTEIKRYTEHGTCTVVAPSGLNIRTAPSTLAEKVGMYNKDESVTYDLVVITNKYVWISWIGASSGKRRYMAIKDRINNIRWGTCI